MSILSGLRSIISSLELFDPRNKTMIVCNSDLEFVLKMKSLHGAELRSAILHHFEPNSTKITSTPKPAAFDPDGHYRVNQALLDVLKNMEEIDVDRKVYTYRELTQLLSSYILKHKEVLFDNRNLRVLFITNTPLERPFNCSVLHLSQIKRFLKNQLLEKVEFGMLLRNKTQIFTTLEKYDIHGGKNFSLM